MTLSVQTSETTPKPTSSDCRCVCGRLAARVVPGGIELKCRRCKRKILVAVSGRFALVRSEGAIALEPEAL